MSGSKAEAVFERPVPLLGRSGLIAILVVIALMVAWEAWVRSEGVTPGYRNSEGLWAEQRRRINNGAGDGWVFAGSSRTMSNMQLSVWERLDKRRPVQLALPGTAPVTVMEGLADDDDFTGKLIVGVAPSLFFSGYEGRRDAIDRYQSESPTQWFGHKVSVLAEPFLAFYTKDFALPAIIRRQPMPVREGVIFDLDIRKIFNYERDRNTRLWDKVVTDEAYRALVKEGWAQNWMPFAKLPPPVQEKLLESRQKQLDRVTEATKKLQAKGAEVIFVHMPYEGHYAVSEIDIAPRDQTWDVLLERTGALGLHFQDHEEMQGYFLPEWSHMTGEEGDRFTEALYELIHRELAARKAAGDKS